MNQNQLIQNGNGIKIQKFKHQNNTSKPGFVDRTTKADRNKSDLGDSFEAPDGGWGWIVAIASGVSVLVTYPVLQQFGLLFRVKFLKVGMTSSELTTIINAQQAAAMCSGLINAPLFRRFSHRQVALIGNFLVFSGLFLAAFANSFISYFICISLFYGTGRGIMFSTMTVAVNTYFKKKRQQATAYQYAVAGIGPIALPYIVTFIVSYYGVIGAVLLLSGFSLHNLACSAVYQPVKWHAKKVPQAVPLEDLEHHNDMNLNADNRIYSSNRPLSNNVIVIGKQVENKSLPEEKELLENLQSTTFDRVKKPSLLKRIVTIFDLDLLKDFGYVNIVIGLTLMNIIHMNFHYLTPFIMHDLGLNSNQTTMAMTVEAICGFVMRLLLILIVARYKCDSKIGLIIGCFVILLGRQVLVFSRNYFVVLCSFGWIGFGSAVVLVFWILVLPSYVPLKKLPAAIGLQRLLMGIFNLIVGPFIGLIRDATDYSFIIHIMNVTIVLVSISWLSENLYRKRRTIKNAN